MTDRDAFGWALVALIGVAAVVTFVLIAPGMFDAFVALFARFV